MKSRALVISRSGEPQSIKPPTKASNAATVNNTRRNQTPDAAETAVLAAVGVKPEEFSDTLASCDSSTGHRNPVWFSARPLIAMYWELCSVHDRFCPALSFTTKAAPMSSTDHGGVKRRAANGQLFAARSPNLKSRLSAMASHRRAAEQRDELAAGDHSITSSARASTIGGVGGPSAREAVLRLIVSSYFEACSTGRSAGFAPLRILSM